MKKILSIFLAVILLMSLVACGGNGNVASTNDTTTPTSIIEIDATEEPNETVVDTDATDDVTAPSQTEDENSEETTENATDATTESTENKQPDSTEPDNTEDESPSQPTVGHTHSYDSSVKAATCTEDGYTLHKCSCGDSYRTDKTSKTGHKFGAWVTTKEATTTATGTAERKCDACGYAETKTLDKKPIFHTHSYTSTVVAPTCTNEGYTVHTCSCGDSYTNTITEKIDHKYTPKVTAPTCTTGGYTTYTCSCGHSYVDEQTGKTDHVYENKGTVAPTCTEKGYDNLVCKNCSGSKVGNEVKALGHAYSENTVAPTCTANGYVQYTCSRCNHSYTNESGAATGHNYQFTSDSATCTADGTKTETCSKCGDVKTSKSKATGHGETRKETKAGTCKEPGYTKEICTKCGEVVSSTTTPVGTCSYTNTERMSQVAQRLDAQGDWEYANYMKYKDWNVNTCSGCGYPDMSTLRFAYSNYEASSIMMGYLNELRASVYGNNNHDLKIDSTLVELAAIRAKEISTNYAHGGTVTGAAENIVADKLNIYDQFNAWKNSSGHYRNMTYLDYNYFGYAVYTVNENAYGVQLFWHKD